MLDFIPIAICFLLPVLIVAIVFAFKSYDVRKKTELVAKALEHGENVDTEKLIKSLSPQKKSIRQKLYTRMTTGLVFSFMGAAIIVIGIMDSYSLGDFKLFGCFVLAIGLAYVASFFFGKHYLAKEIEKQDNKAEE